MSEPGDAGGSGRSGHSGSSSLAGRITSGDQQALGELYDKTSSLVHGLCLRILRDATSAEEVTLEVYLQAWNQAAAYDPSRGSVEAWLLIIARSRALDRLRGVRARREREHEIDRDFAIEPPAPADGGLEAIAADRRRILSDALSHVSREEREVIGCAYFSGMSHSEIAMFLKQPLGTVKSRIRSGLSKLRRTLEPLAAGGVSW